MGKRESKEAWAFLLPSGRSALWSAETVLGQGLRPWPLRPWWADLVFLGSGPRAWFIPLSNSLIFGCHPFCRTNKSSSSPGSSWYVFKYVLIDFSWWDAILSGAFIPPEVWKKYWKWVSADNVPKRFKKTDYQPVFPAPFNEAAYLGNNPLLDVEHTPLIKVDETITQLPKAFLVSCMTSSMMTSCSIRSAWRTSGSPWRGTMWRMAFMDLWYYLIGSLSLSHAPWKLSML